MGDFYLRDDEETGIIFLDFDGVLATARSLSCGMHTLDAACVAVLDEFMADHPEARIVVSSTWRFSHTLKGIRGKLDENGFHFSDRIIGTTRVNQKRIGALYAGETRGQEIDEWLTTHYYLPERRPLWIIVLDDDKDVEPFGSYHVRPQFESGLTRKHLSEMERMVEGQMAGRDTRRRANR